MNKRILFVDDEVNLLSGLKRQFGRKYEVVTASGGADGLAEIKKSKAPFAVVISDMRMPEMDGVEFLAKVRDQSPDTVRIMLTGNNDQETAVAAINDGAIFRFYTKPCRPAHLDQGINDAIEQYRLVTAERSLLEQTLGGSVKLLMDVLAIVDPSSVGKASRIRDWAVEAIKWNEWASPWKINLAAMLSPIGRIALPDEINEKISKGQKLDREEAKVARNMPEVCRNLVANIPRLKSVGDILYYQNKNFDGSGFPKDDVKGEDIPLESRILHVLNDLVKITRSKDTELPFTSEFDKLEQKEGRYDPEILQGLRAYFISKKEGHGDKEHTEIVEAKIGRLLPGDVLVSEIKTKKGMLALGAGQEISRTIREKLNMMRQSGKIEDGVRVLRTITPKESETED